MPGLKERPLTKAQEYVLEVMAEKGSAHSGRGGFNEGVYRALERRGLVRLVKTWTWEKDWGLTDAGRPVAQEIRARLKAERNARWEREHAR